MCCYSTKTNYCSTFPSYTGAAGVLRLCTLVHHPAHHTALVHLPSIPQRRNTCRDLEDHLQGALGVSCVPNTDCDVLPRRPPAPDEDIMEKFDGEARRKKMKVKS